MLYCAILGGVALGQAAPNIQYFVAGKAAGARLFAVLRRQPLIADQPGGSPIDKAAVKTLTDASSKQYRITLRFACAMKVYGGLAIGSGGVCGL